MQWFRAGLVIVAERLCVSLNSRLEGNRQEEEGPESRRRRVLERATPPAPRTSPLLQLNIMYRQVFEVPWILRFEPSLDALRLRSDVMKHSCCAQGVGAYTRAGGKEVFEGDWQVCPSSYSLLPHPGGGGGHFCGRVARLATSQGLLQLSPKLPGSEWKDFFLDATELASRRKCAV